MKTIAIFVATTGGPAQIERLTPEFAPQSMVCLRRGSNILPISGDYDDFVKRGSGVIEREFGPFDYASFRLDVSESIGTGKSWQLGVFAAHAVTASDQAVLAGSDDHPDMVIWLTGEVDYDLGVGSVGHVPEKIAASQDFFKAWRKTGMPVLSVVPQGQNSAAMMQTELPQGVEVRAASNATEIFDHLGLTDIVVPAAPAEQLNAVVSDGKNKQGLVGAILGVVVVLALAGWAIGPDRLSGMMENFKASASKEVIQEASLKPAAKESAKNSPEKLAKGLPSSPKGKPVDRQSTKPEAIPALHVMEQRPPANSTCAKVHFSRVEAETREVKKSGAAELAISDKKNLCGLKFVFDLGQTSQFIAAKLELESGSFVRGNTRPSILSGVTKAKGEQVWSLNVPRRLAEPLQYSLTAVIGKEPVAAELLWLKKQSDGKQAARTLAKKGFSVLTWRHKVAP